MLLYFFLFPCFSFYSKLAKSLFHLSEIFFKKKVERMKKEKKQQRTNKTNKNKMGKKLSKPSDTLDISNHKDQNYQDDQEENKKLPFFIKMINNYISNSADTPLPILHSDGKSASHCNLGTLRNINFCDQLSGIEIHPKNLGCDLLFSLHSISGVESARITHFSHSVVKLPAAAEGSSFIDNKNHPSYPSQHRLTYPPRQHYLSRQHHLPRQPQHYLSRQPQHYLSRQPQHYSPRQPQQHYSPQRPQAAVKVDLEITFGQLTGNVSVEPINCNKLTGRLASLMIKNCHHSRVLLGSKKDPIVVRTSILFPLSKSRDKRMKPHILSFYLDVGKVELVDCLEFYQRHFPSINTKLTTIISEKIGEFLQPLLEKVIQKQIYHLNKFF
jgi:hypothetical protein